MAYIARITGLVVLFAGALLPGCGKPAQAVDDTADVVTGAQSVRVGREIERDLRKTVNDARERTNAALREAEGEPEEE